LLHRLLGKELPTEPKQLGAILAYALAEAKRIPHRPSKLLVLSAPKSGRTWLMFMLDRLGVHLRFTHFGYGYPDDWRDYRFILLHRDPRDVLLSRYHGRKNRGGRRRGLQELLDDPHKGLLATANFNLTWAERLGQTRGYHILRYEDLLRDTFAELSKILRFLNIHRSAQAIERAVEDGSIGNMRRIEESGEAPPDPSDPTTFKVRAGRAGGWQAQFTDEQKEKADALLAGLGYFERMAAVDMAARTSSQGAAHNL
jgi:hypothetical protein